MPLAAVLWGISALAAASNQLPSVWMGAGFDGRRISVSAIEENAKPRLIAIEDSRRRKPGSIDVTDLAFDTKRKVVYVATCCEPGSGQLFSIEITAPKPKLTADDQGFAVDVSGALRVRTDTWGTFVTRNLASAGSQRSATQNIRESTGIADVAVSFTGRPRIIALVNSRRLRTLVPTTPAPRNASADPALWIQWQTTDGTDMEVTDALPADSRYCRVVPLSGSAIGLLVGEPDPLKPWLCIGDALDVFDRAEVRKHAVKFPAHIRHLSIDDSSTFLIFTTVDGAVGWRTLEGQGGVLADSGFAAADW